MSNQFVPGCLTSVHNSKLKNVCSITVYLVTLVVQSYIIFWVGVLIVRTFMYVLIEQTIYFFTNVPVVCHDCVLYTWNIVKTCCHSCVC